MQILRKFYEADDYGSGGNHFKRWEHLYGQRVSMNDRFETEHTWCEELALRNEGRFIPKPIVSPTPTSPKEVKSAESVEAWYHNWMKEKGKTGGAVTVNVLDMLKDFASQFPLGAPVSKDALTEAVEPTASDITSLFKNQKQ